MCALNTLLGVAWVRVRCVELVLGLRCVELLFLCTFNLSAFVCIRLSTFPPLAAPTFEPFNLSIFGCIRL